MRMFRSRGTRGREERKGGGDGGDIVHWGGGERGAEWRGK